MIRATLLKRRHFHIIALAAALAASANSYASTPQSHVARVADRPDRLDCHAFDGAREPLLRVLTLNVAHGRKDGPNQLFLARSRFLDNLAHVTQLLQAIGADIVALQEADGPSAWSGGFDHAATLADAADYPWHYRADHAESWIYRYGTAVLSRLPIRATRSHRFAASPPSPRKGFVVSEVSLPGSPAGPGALSVDVLSVHLDFMSRRAQAQQVAELAATIRARNKPTIVLGDFNSDWLRPDSTVRRLAARTGLVAYETGADDLATHRGTRIDWILISDELRFQDYRVLPDIVSDHQPVYAEIGINPAGPLAPECPAPAPARGVRADARPSD